MSTENTLDDITAGLTTAYYLEVGDPVQDEHGVEGEVLGFSATGDPVVLFDNGERTVDMNKETLMKKGEYIRPGVFRVASKRQTEVPLEKSADMGFRKVFAGAYVYEPTEVQAAKYPWDMGSIWHVHEKEGRKMLVKEEATSTTVGEPDNKPMNQLDNAGDNNAPHTEDFHLFD